MLNLPLATDKFLSVGAMKTASLTFMARSILVPIVSNVMVTEQQLPHPSKENMAILHLKATRKATRQRPRLL
jgi:hypothetical protein